VEGKNNAETQKALRGAQRPLSKCKRQSNVRRRDGKIRNQRQQIARHGEFRVSDVEFRACSLLFGGTGFGGGVGIFLGEALDTAGRVHELLLASEERVTVRADFHTHHFALDGRACLERVAAGAVHGHGVIVGMNTGFHGAAFRRVRSARPTRQSRVKLKK